MCSHRNEAGTIPPDQGLTGRRILDGVLRTKRAQEAFLGQTALVLRIAVAAAKTSEAREVAAVWTALDAGSQRAPSERVQFEVVPGPVGASISARHHLVVGVGSIDQPEQIAAVDVCIESADAERIWTERLNAFRDNLADGRRAPRRRTAELVEPDPSWPVHASRLIARLEDACGNGPLRIDHIGSTSVPGLAAKDLIDIQIVVRDLAVAEAVATHGSRAGFVRVAGEWDAPDRLGRRFPEVVMVDADPGRPVNVNIRPIHDPVWREVLLFRDWLRASAEHRSEYEALKRSLARATRDVDSYSDAKLPWIGEALTRANAWALATKWSP